MQTQTSTSYAQEIVELVHFVHTLSLSEAERRKAERLLLRLNDRVTQRNLALQLCKNAIEDIRLDAECLIFDLEATRRERDELCRELERIRREKDSND